MKKALAYLDNTVYDGKSKILTWELHVSNMRQSFNDLEYSGNAISPEMQVERLVQSFQHPQLDHLSTTINTVAPYRNDFNQAIGLISAELANLKLKNSVRTVAGISTAEDEEPALEMGSEESPKLLIVEDHPDVSQYLIALLRDKYQILLLP